MPDVPSTETHELTVYPQEAGQAEVLQIATGRSLYAELTRRGFSVASACGGVGTCGKCLVLLHEGLRPPTEAEKVHLSAEALAAGWRLSCQQAVDRPMTVTTPVYDETTLAKEQLSQTLHVALDPGIVQTLLALPPPSHTDQRSDVSRLTEGLDLGRLDFSLAGLRRLPEALRADGFRVAVTHEGSRVLSVEPRKARQTLYGLAVDIGTTTLAGYLLDLTTGEEVAIRSRMNPQHRFGADVISRIKQVHERGEAGQEELRRAVVDGINSLIHRVCEAARIEPSQVVKTTVVGNPTMLHLFAGIPPSYIDHSPYTPVLQEGVRFDAARMELQLHPEASVYLFPSISGYVGGDITAGVLFSEMHRYDALSLFVDIGTNAEIVLGNRDRLIACSTPAGPAFEGARIVHGMSATPGAITYARFDLARDVISLQVIGNVPPRGICGSGLIDLGAELLKVGAIDDKGTLRASGSPIYAERVSPGLGGQPQFQVASGRQEIWLTQRDIRELQLAKGAIRAGIDLLLQEWGAAPESVERVYLAGAFGNYVRRESVLRLGMLPPFPPDQIVPLGNAAGQGAKLALLNRGKWDEVCELANRVRYLELSYHEGFSEAFMTSMRFPSPSEADPAANGTARSRQTEREGSH